MCWQRQGPNRKRSSSGCIKKREKSQRQKPEKRKRKVIGTGGCNSGGDNSKNLIRAEQGETGPKWQRGETQIIVLLRKTKRNVKRIRGRRNTPTLRKTSYHQCNGGLGCKKKAICVGNQKRKGEKKAI